MSVLTEKNLPAVVSFFNDATAVGKSFGALRTRCHCDDAKITTQLVCVETAGVEKTLRKGDVFIPAEAFAKAAQLPGGIAGVLQPYSAAALALAGTRSVLIADLGGGLARHYAEYLAATRFDQLLFKRGITAVGVVVTTNRYEHMREALQNLDMLTTTVPRMRRCLLLNARFGAFNFISDSPADTMYRELMRRAEDGCAVIRFPAIGGDSWKYAEDAALSMNKARHLTEDEFAERTKLDPLTAAACLTEIDAFYATTEVALGRVFRFQKKAE